MPKPIVALARRYQRDALRISTVGEDRGHGDITYQAVAVAPPDIEAAAINLLRLHDAETAILFCATRDNVRHLSNTLNERGFQVVALSGEHSQAERNHAMQALRDGRARVCVATDVADAPLIADHPEVAKEVALQGFDGARAYSADPQRSVDLLEAGLEFERRDGAWEARGEDRGGLWAYDAPPADHFALGRALAPLRDRGVLIVGSGNVVHNLRASRRGASAMQAYDWASEFDARLADWLAKGDLAALALFQDLGSVARMAHPSTEHYLPLLHAAGAVDAREPLRSFNTAFQSASISMRSLVWG